MPSNLPTRVLHSVWDRLLDRRALATERAEATANRELERLKGAVRRDLEWLLNTHRAADSDVPPGRSQLDRSLVTYGLPDLNNRSLANPEDCKYFQALLERTIRTFEPRLADVRVTYDLEDQSPYRAALNFRVQAMLRVEPAPEPVVFDTVLELGSKTFSVKVQQ